MNKIHSKAELQSKLQKTQKAFLLLYKSGSEQSDCALRHLSESMSSDSENMLFSADVSSTRDIHAHYGITSVPSLLIFESGKLSNVVKGCQEPDFYKAITGNAIFMTKAEKEGRTVKRVTVYSTPTCSWCNTLKSWLRKNNIPFTDVDVSRDQHAAEDLVRRTGQQGVPQTDINGQVVVGFNQARLKELLEI